MPNEKIISCCTCTNEENIYILTKKAKLFCIGSDEIYCANESSMGYLNDRTQLKDDYFLKILSSNSYIDIETNKNKSARLSLEKLKFKFNKTNFLIDFLQLEKDEYLENCFQLINFPD